ncbi:MAG: nucleotidyltransferase domain-containing protein [Parabacteroides sp.]|mgnify:FL=1|jgi:uncharacterized protein|nr:nucleotidyltransferase domain-containing protein [Parabacteroides sp.]
MDKNEAIILAKRYKELVSQHFQIKALYLYGSYSKGTQNPDSDIDIAVIVDHIEGDYFDYLPLLWKLRRKINSIIEPVLLTEEDQTTPLYAEILKTGQII